MLADVVVVRFGSAREVRPWLSNHCSEAARSSRRVQRRSSTVRVEDSADRTTELVV
jgi:hypothetical protein